MSVRSYGTTTVFSSRIKLLRDQSHHSMDSFSEFLGISKSQIYRWERGESEPSAQLLADLSRKLGVTADYLLGLVDKPHQMLAEEELTPGERKVLMAIRAGMTVEAIEAVLALKKEGAKT
jgi:transcriptional regulator with XRE-family HTH domain